MKPYRRQRNPREQAILMEAAALRRWGRELSQRSWELRELVTMDVIKRGHGWPGNPERLQRLLELAARIGELREQAQSL